MSFPLPNDHDELDLLWADPTGSICLICGMFETFDGQEPYLVCFECGHVYRSSLDLVDDYERDIDWSWEGSPDEIPFCPNCLHDF